MRSRYLLPGLALLLLPGLALRDGARASRERASGEARVEHFVLMWDSEAPHPAASWNGPDAVVEAVRRGEVGLVELRRHEQGGGPQLELEVSFPVEDIRVLAVECLDPRAPRLVWREVSGGAGRTVFAEWTAESEELRVLEWGLDGRLRERRSTREGAVMPLYLLELIRSGSANLGSFEVLDPLAHDLETWSVSTTYEREGEEYDRIVELRRTDGSLAGRYTFRGDELSSFRWHVGGLVARRIDADAYAEREAAWGPDSPPD